MAHKSWHKIERKTEGLRSCKILETGSGGTITGFAFSHLSSWCLSAHRLPFFCRLISAWQETGCEAAPAFQREPEGELYAQGRGLCWALLDAYTLAPKTGARVMRDYIGQLYCHGQPHLSHKEWRGVSCSKEIGVLGRHNNKSTPALFSSIRNNQVLLFFRTYSSGPLGMHIHIHITSYSLHPPLNEHISIY